MSHNRNNWLDIAKGIAIILMVAGHTPIPGVVSHFIYAFHMPLFFIASGLVSNYEKYSLVDYIRHKLYTLLLPFICYSAIVALLMYSVGELDVMKLLKRGWGGYALWFVPVLFMACILVRIVFLTKKKNTRRFIMLCFLFIGYGLRHYEISLPWNLSAVPYASFLIMSGKELASCKKRIEAPSHYWDILVLIIITTVISQFWRITGQFWRLDLAWNQITPIIPLTLGALAGTLMLFRLSVWIENKTKFISTILQRVGRETYVVLAFSQITIMCINHFFTLNPLLKYGILVVVLILLKYLKDGINQLVKIKIL